MKTYLMEFNKQNIEIRTTPGTLNLSFGDVMVRQNRMVHPIRLGYVIEPATELLRPFFMEKAQDYLQNDPTSDWRHAHYNRLIEFTEEYKYATGYWGFFCSGFDLKIR